MMLLLLLLFCQMLSVILIQSQFPPLHKRASPFIISDCVCINICLIRLSFTNHPATAVCISGERIPSNLT